MRTLFLLVALSLPFAAWAQPREATSSPDPSLATHARTAFRAAVRSMERWKGALWIGHYGLGLTRLSDDGELRSYRSESSPLLENRINGLSHRDGELWIGTCKGISITDGRRWRKQGLKDGVAGEIYHCIRRDHEGRLWVGTTGQGLSRWDGRKWKTFTTADGLPHGWINDVLVTPDDEVWVATLNGIARGPLEGPFRSVHPPGFPVYRNATALCLIEDTLWVGSSDGGLFACQDGQWMHPPLRYLPHLHVTSLAKGRDGSLWIGTRKGVTHYRFGRGWRKFGPKQGLHDAFVKLVHVDEDGSVLVGTQAGWVLRWDGNRSWSAILHEGRLPRP